MQNGIRVRIFGDDSDLKKTLGDSAKRIAKWSAVAATAAAVGGAALVKSGLENVDAQAKLAKQLNTTSADLAKVKRAFDLAGVSQEQLRSGTRALTNRLSQAAQGTGPAADAFEKLGLSLEYVSSLPLSEKIDAINTALNNNVDENERAAIAAKIYGEEAALAIAKIDPNTIRRAGKEVEALGAAFSEIDAKKVEDANDALGALKLAAGGVRDRFTIELADAITAVAESIKEEFTEAGTDMQTAIKSAANASIEAFATILEGAGGILSFIDNNKELTQFGVLGYIVFGTKGGLLGAAIGATFSIIKENLADVGVSVNDAEHQARRFLNVQEDIAKQEFIIQRRRDSADPDAIYDQFNPDPVAAAVEELEKLKKIEAELQIGVDSNSESLEYFNALMSDSSGIAGTLSQGFRSAASALRDLQTSQDGIEITAEQEKLNNLLAMHQQYAKARQESGEDASKTDTERKTSFNVGEDPEVIAEQNKRDKMLAIYQDYATQRGASGENFRLTDLERQNAFNGAPDVTGQNPPDDANNKELEERLERLRESYMSERELIDSEEQGKLELLREARESGAILVKDYEDLKTNIEKDAADAREAIADQEMQNKLSMASSAFGNLSSLMESENKKMFEVGKVAALAQAAIDGYAAVASSYRAGALIGGPVVGAAFAATAGVAAAQNFANIANTSFGSKSAPSAPGGGSNPQVPQQQEQQHQQQSEPERVLRLERLDPSALVSGEVVNRLAEELVQYQKDGFNLVAS